MDRLVSVLSALGENGTAVADALLDAGAIELIGPATGPVIVAERHCLRFGDITVGLSFDDPRSSALLLSAYKANCVGSRRCDIELVVLSGPRGIGIAEQGARARWFARRRSAPEFKVAIATAVIDSLKSAVLLHAAVLERDGGGLMVIGEPGAGKTTLSIALAGCNFALLGDDVAELASDGRVRAVPFPLTVKSGAWPLLAKYRPDLDGAPTFLRSDGQHLRYLSPLRLSRRGLIPVRWVLALDRAKGAHAKLHRVGVAEALNHLVRSAWSADRRLSADGFEGLVSCAAGAEVWRLEYDDLDEAVTVVDRACTAAV